MYNPIYIKTSFDSPNLISNIFKAARGITEVSSESSQTFKIELFGRMIYIFSFNL